MFNSSNYFRRALGEEIQLNNILLYTITLKTARMRIDSLKEFKRKRK